MQSVTIVVAVMSVVIKNTEKTAETNVESVVNVQKNDKIRLHNRMTCGILYMV